MFWRYLLASLAALAVDAAVLAFGVRALALAPGLASGIGYAAGALVHYRVSRARVFAPGWLGRMPLAEFAAFIASGACGLLITVGVVHLLSSLGVGLALAKAAAVVLSFLAVYLLRVALVFRRAAP